MKPEILNTEITDLAGATRFVAACYDFFGCAYADCDEMVHRLRQRRHIITGFHPDTPGDQYFHGPNTRSLSDGQAEQFDSRIAECRHLSGVFLGSDDAFYELACWTVVGVTIKWGFCDWIQAETASQAVKLVLADRRKEMGTIVAPTAVFKGRQFPETYEV